MMQLVIRTCADGHSGVFGTQDYEAVSSSPQKAISEAGHQTLLRALFNPNVRGHI